MNPNSNSNDKSNNNGGREGEPELDADGLPVDPKLRTTHQNRIRKQNQRANEKAVRQYKADQVTKAKLKKELDYEKDEEILAGIRQERELEIETKKAKQMEIEEARAKRNAEEEKKREAFLARMMEMNEGEAATQQPNAET